MKKLLFTAVAVATGMAMANSVESSNIVGYQTIDGVQGFNFTAPTFDAVANAIDIQDIKLVFAEGDSAQGVDNLQILDAGGATVETYNWMPKDWMYPVPQNDGWMDGNTGGLAVKTINKGQGFIVDLASATTKIMYSGQVTTTNTEIADTVQGFNWTGNNIPRNIDIQDIKLVFAEGDSAQGVDNLRFLMQVVLPLKPTTGCLKTGCILSLRMMVGWMATLEVLQSKKFRLVKVSSLILPRLEQ